jgi:membrane protease YdiL (CAAX protease family)
MDAASIAQDGGEFAPIRDRIRPAIELLTVVSLLEAELWYLRAGGPAWLNVLVYGIIVATLWLSYDRRRKADRNSAHPAMGLARSWVEVLATCLVLSTILMAVARFLGDSSETFEFVFLDKPPTKLLGWLVGKFGAALGQQLALQLFLWPVCFEVTKSRAAGTLVAASIFGVIHLPSLVLVAITWLAGLVWIALYRRTGRLAPLIVSHMILATLAHGALPERLTYDMRVGLTATADMKRFETLKDPKIRLANRRLKENRASLKHFTSTEYFHDQGGSMHDFIRGLYRDILGRPASESDVAFWLSRPLENPRVDIPSMFLASDEYAQILERRANSSADRLRR